MKMNRKYLHIAVVRSAIELSTMETVAERISKLAKMEVSKVKSSGFVLRQVSGDAMELSKIKRCIFQGICDVLDDDIVEATEYISEHYDVSFNPDNLDQDVMVDLLDIERDGRLIYVELDL